MKPRGRREDWGQESDDFIFLWSSCRVVRALVLFGWLVSAVGAWAGEVSFHDHVRPILAVHCGKCHGAEEQKGGLRLDERAAALRGGDSGAVIVPGKAAESGLLRRVTSRDADEQMPPKGTRLSAEEVATLRAWIDGGARWPERDDYWAFQPPRELQVPPGDAAHPVDRFLNARLAAANVTVLPPADARTVLRRAYFDLVGVPPSPEEAAAFLAQPETGYAALLDRLLADPRYGERWARHWLDLVRYGESDGFEDDKVRPLAWRYRDYVIRALNADKPYDRFVQEQLAGDELWPDSPDAWIATGFLRLGAWDGMSKEPEKQRADFLNDATDATGAVFLGMTLGCARCHDHKYDAISQRDYYAMQAFFGGVERQKTELKARPEEPEFVTAAFKEDSARLAKLRAERAALLAAARKALGNDKASDDDMPVAKWLHLATPATTSNANSTSTVGA